MNTSTATKVYQLDTQFKYNPENGLRVSRYFTKDNITPFDQFEYELRSSIIREPSGKIIFEMTDVEVPKTWSQVATDILAQKYFRKAGVPQYNDDGTVKMKADGTIQLGPEKSIKQVAHRMAGTWRYWGEKYGYFASATDAQVFYDELTYMIIGQLAAPNSPQWFNTGLQWAYGINGPAQGHYYVDPDTGVMTQSIDAYTHPQPHACGRYDTKIFTEKGIFNLGDIVEENLVGTRIFDGEKMVKVLAVKNNGIRKLYRAGLRNGNFIDFTDDHLVWSADRRLKDGGQYGWHPLSQIVGHAVHQFALDAVEITNSKLSEEIVLSVEYIAEEEVYDIQTETGKFCANGVVVHNCFIQSVKDDLVNEGGIMDLWVREARLFKYGSGTGTNFSGLRGGGEKLSGGGTSSGLMSWLKIGDRAAGAIKSGGTTRRAAKMVILNVDHPDIETFVEWKVNEEKKVAALVAAGYDSSYESEAYQTVSGQNSNNSVRVTQEFLESVENDNGWELKWRTNGQVCKKLKARDLWDKIARATWACADPGLQYDSTINDWHTCPQSGRINASNPCSEYMFIDDTACNLASINLAHFYNSETISFDVAGFKHATRVWTTVLEISILMAQYPSEQIARGSYDFRSLGLGYANIGSVLMTAGIPYDSKEALAFAGCITSLMTSESYTTSAEMARSMGVFPKYNNNREDMLRVMRNHRRAAFNTKPEEYEGLSVAPVGIDPQYAPAYLLVAARESWNHALDMGERFGYRNAQTTLLAPTGTIGLLMDCATTGVEPDFALVKFKKLAGGGYFKIVNESVPAALRTLGYNESQVNEIVEYLKGHGSLHGATGINHESLLARGLNADDITKIEKGLPAVFELPFAFNVWTLGEDCLQRLGFSSEQYNDSNFNLLLAMGYTAEEITTANEYVCGAMTIEGAPHLKKEHYPVFDTANKNGKKGLRYIHYLGHIRMMAAVQPFLSGAISKTINMPSDATVEDIKIAFMASWKLGLKANAIYRDGCKLSQPLSAKSKDSKKDDPGSAKATPGEGAKSKEQASGELVRQSVADKKYSLSSKSEAVHNQIVEDTFAQINYAHDGSVQGSKIYIHGEQRRLPFKRSGLTIKSKVQGQKVFLRTGEYPDGKLGEIFIDMYKEGAAFRSVLNLFAVAISTGLQYGVPLEEYVEKFTFTRFEPSGMTDHPNIRNCTSIIDLVFRMLGMEYLGRTDFVQVKPKGIQKNRAEQMARMAAEMHGQHTLDFKDKAADEVEKEKLDTKDFEEKNQMSLPGVPAIGIIDQPAVSGADQMLSGMMGDAPPCPTCGHITIRNGSCYKCLNCGSTTGCS